MANYYTCDICDKPINKNHESYRGRMTIDMVLAIRNVKPAFHVKDDICTACGEKYAEETSSAKKPGWMERRLG